MALFPPSVVLRGFKPSTYWQYASGLNPCAASLNEKIAHFQSPKKLEWGGQFKNNSKKTEVIRNYIMKAETNFGRQTVSEYIVTITGCFIWSYITVWGCVTNHSQSISIAGYSLLPFMLFVYGDTSQINNLIKFIKSWIKN
jgi:hypothetical protein